MTEKTLEEKFEEKESELKDLKVQMKEEDEAAHEKDRVKLMPVKSVKIQSLSGVCPYCGESVRAHYEYGSIDNFCSVCGQALFWPDQESLNNELDEADSDKGKPITSSWL